MNVITAAGTLGTTAAATLDTVTTGFISSVRSILLVNTNAASRTVNIYIKPNGGTARRYLSQSFTLAAAGSAGDTKELIDVPGRLVLNSQDQICGDASNAGDVEFVISRLEQ